MKYNLSSLAVCLFILNVSAAAADWTFLDVNRSGAADFIKNNPAYDGRGAVIIVLDTGIDLGTPGLTELPDGGVKIIDVQDFSGEGDVYLEEAEEGNDEYGKFLKNSDGLRLDGFNKLKYQAEDSLYYIGVLEEERFKNSLIPDINTNGKTNDRFGLIIFKTENGWPAYVDLDADGNLDDEQPLWNYKEKLQHFSFRGRDPEMRKNPAAFALNIFEDELRVNFHFDGDDHGTHVAGIAAGYKINGQEGFNGIAPGAKLISLKIGDCRLEGGATTTGSMLDAYEYGIEFAKKYDGPVVFNMSFGIGSEIEVMADMDLMLDDFLAENENLLFITSAGNEGPGISTVGLPAAAKRILSVGALNTIETARDLYGADIADDKLFVFSSRGGEVNKPDLTAPGGLSSTVPPFSSSDTKWGTSMAAPQAAGAAALILSAAHQQKPPLHINGAMLKKALKNGAVPLPDYLPLEQGSGVLNVPRAFEFYKKYITARDYEKLLGYEISTISPVYSSENGETAYWRFGDFAPDKNEKQRFYIDPVFPKNLNADQKNSFYRAFELKTDESWIKFNKANTFIKGTNAASVDVYFDKEKMREPGLYNGRISAYKKGSTKASAKEFELLCTVVRPIIFSSQNNYSWKSGRIKIKPGDVKRYFFDIPLQASAANIKINTVNSDFANVRGYLYDPAGRETEHYFILNSKSAKTRVISLSKNQLDRGTWELDLYTDFRTEETSYAEVSIMFSGLETSPAVISRVRVNNDGESRGNFSVLNHYNDKIKSRLSGVIDGIQKKTYIDDESDRYEHYFHVSDNFDKVVFEFELKPEIFNYFTDFPVNIKDYSGKVFITDGFTTRKLKITFIPEKSGDYILELLPAFAGHETKNWQASLTESYYYYKKQIITGSASTFYPRVWKDCTFRIDGVLPVAPDGFYLFGEIRLDSRDINRFRTIIPVRLSTGLND